VKTDLTKIILIYTSLISLISISGCSLNTRVNQLEAENNAQQTEIDRLNEQITGLAAFCQSSAPTRFVDNGDGTICDNQTGLMWEKKLAETDSACTDTDQANRDVHCVNNVYSWTDEADEDNRNPDGTAFMDFLATLNQEVTDDSYSTCFAGYCDWRLPRLVELRSILLESIPSAIQVPCSTSSCIDPIFGPLADPPIYWSSTSNADNPDLAWVVHFSDGRLFSANKRLLLNGRVRAVRRAGPVYGYDWGGYPSP